MLDGQYENVSLRSRMQRIEETFPVPNGCCFQLDFSQCKHWLIGNYQVILCIQENCLRLLVCVYGHDVCTRYLKAHELGRK